MVTDKEPIPTRNSENRYTVTLSRQAASLVSHPGPLTLVQNRYTVTLSRQAACLVSHPGPWYRKDIQ